MKTFWERFSLAMPQGIFFRSVGLVALGSIVSQALSALLTPILTHLYTPSEFGIFTIFVSILGVLNTFDSCTYETAIPLPEDEETARDLVVLASSILLLSSCICLLFLWRHEAREVLSARVNHLGDLRLLLPVGMLGFGTYQILNLWTIRRKDFRTVVRSKIIQAVTLGLVQIPVGIAGWGGLGLVVGYLGSQFAGIGAMLRRSGLGPLRLSWTRIWAVALVYRKFPIFQMWATLTGAIGLQIPVLVIAAYFGTSTAGNYGLTMRILGLPVALFGQSVSQVFYPVLASRASDASAVQEMMEKAILSLLLPSICIFGLIAIGGPLLFPLVFGQAWVESGHIARILAPWFLLWFVSSPISSIMIVKHRQGTALALNLAEMAVRVGAIWIGVRSGSYQMAMVALSLAGVIICGVFITIALRLSGSSTIVFYSRYRNLLIPGGLAIISIGILIAFSSSFPGWITLALGMCVLVPFAGFTCIKLARSVNGEVAIGK